MCRPVKQNQRDIGLAEERYLEPGEFDWRQKVAQRLRHIAKWNDSNWINPSWERHILRSHRLRKQADRFEFCGMQHSVIQCLGCSRVIIGRRRCEIRICLHCSKKYSARVRRKQTDLLKRFPRRKGKWWMFFTVTRRRHPMYRPQTSDAQQTFRLLRRLLNKFWPRKSGCGALAVLELGKKGHIHIHVLVYGHYVPQVELSNLWLELTGDSQVVDIRAVRNERKCLNYILKYLTQQSAKQPKKKQNHEEEKDDVLEVALLLDLLLGMRRIRTYGVLYNFPLSSKDACPCPLCGEKFVFRGFEDGRFVRVDALFFDEALALAQSYEN